MIMLSTSSDLRRSLAEPVSTAFNYKLSDKPRVIPISHARHMRGVHPVRFDHPAVPFESRLESQFISYLASLREFRSIRSQPITVNFVGETNAKRYTPDFLVELSSVPNELARLGFAKRTYVEIKPLARALHDKGRLMRKFSVLHQATGLPVTLVTDVDLRELFREVRHGA